MTPPCDAIARICSSSRLRMWSYTPQALAWLTISGAVATSSDW